MSPPISSAIKERVIQLYLEGKGRNKIAQTLNLSHIRISQGSVTNILNAWKGEHDNPYTSPPRPEPEAKHEASSPVTEPEESFESEPLTLQKFLQ